MKSFKRKEQLTLHIVIHSGEKKHVCIECGKGKRMIKNFTILYPEYKTTVLTIDQTFVQTIVQAVVQTIVGIVGQTIIQPSL